MSSSYQPGGDAQAISRVAHEHFGGNYATMFEAHGWTLKHGQHYMHQASSRIVDHYGSIAAFEFSFNLRFRPQMEPPDAWTEDTSVLLTSFWDWTPDTWSAIGWSHKQGQTRRENLLKQLSDPFVAVIYVTKATNRDPKLAQKVAGFFFVSHQTGDRDEFTHTIHHAVEPERWRHALKATHAFSFIPEYRPSVEQLFPEIRPRVVSVASMGEVIANTQKIGVLRRLPRIEVPVYCSSRRTNIEPTNASLPNFVRSGPSTESGYIALHPEEALPRELYVLRLTGDTNAFLGWNGGGRSIYKIGLSVSPETRRQAFEKTLPKGAFGWAIEKSTVSDNDQRYANFEIALAGEDAMKIFLAEHGHHLGGEFYLCSPNDLERAWALGREAALGKAAFLAAERIQNP